MIHVKKTRARIGPARQRLPFEFGGKPLARPRGVSGGLIETHMRDRLIVIKWLCAMQRENIAVIQPIERRAPALALFQRPAVGKPEFRPLITAIRDERAIFAIRHRARGKPERLQQNLVTRAFIVEGKAVAIMTDGDNAARMRDPFERGRAPHLARPRGRISGQQRIGEKRMLDIGQDQFLMLLLMMEAERDQRRKRVIVREQIGHRDIDMMAIGHDLRSRGARQQPALRRADGAGRSPHNRN